MFYSELDIFAFSYSYLGYLLTALKGAEDSGNVYRRGMSIWFFLRFIPVFYEIWQPELFKEYVIYNVIHFVWYPYSLCLFTRETKNWKRDF